MEGSEELIEQEPEAERIFSEQATEFADMSVPPEGGERKKVASTSRSLAAMGGTMPDLEDTPKRRQKSQ